MKTDVPKRLTEDITNSREQLRQRKPRVYEKLMNYLQAEKEGRDTKLSLIDFAFNYDCNFRCPHCCAEVFRGLSSQASMSVKDVKHIADQADELGFFIFSLIGGEPLVWKDFDRIIEAVDARRFHISVTTNGWLLTPAKAEHLKALGVDKVGISIDSGFAEEHDKFRSKTGSFGRAIEAAKNAKAAGLRTIISAVVTHQNIGTDGFKRLLEISRELDIGLDLQCATVAGGWRGHTEVLIDKDDSERLKDLRREYDLLRRDVWSTPGSKGGCPASIRSVYIIPSGDVLPCLFIHVSFGNTLKEPLGVILERMAKVKELHEGSPLCLAGEDREFIGRYLSKTFDQETLPLDYRQVFGNYYSVRGKG